MEHPPLEHEDTNWATRKGLASCFCSRCKGVQRPVSLRTRQRHAKEEKDLVEHVRKRQRLVEEERDNLPSPPPAGSDDEDGGDDMGQAHSGHTDNLEYGNAEENCADHAYGGNVQESHRFHGPFDHPGSPLLSGSSGTSSSDDEEQGDLQMQREAEEAERLAALHSTVTGYNNSPGDGSHQDNNDDPDDLDGRLDSESTTQFSRIEDIKITQQFISLIRSATLDNGNLDPDVIERLRSPIAHTIDISDPDHRLSLDLFLAVTTASEATYNATREAILRRYPDSGILTYYQVKKLVAEITGIVSVTDDMCINSCHAFTGPFSDLEACSICGELRYDPKELARTGKKVSRLQFETILLGPQLQAIRRSVKGATERLYRHRKLQEIEELLRTLDPAMNGADMIYDDIWSGSDFLEFVARMDMSEDDTVVASSLDGAQLYQNKKSDTWIGIWIVEDYHPHTRYKKKRILPSIFIPGPNKPKIIDSFLFRALHHVSALQCENSGRGFCIWDAVKNAIVLSRLVFALGTADAMGMPDLDGRVGHHGAQGCRLGCPMKGRHKPNSGHYYAAHARPINSTVPDCDHDDIDIRNISPISPEVYRKNLETLLSSISVADFERNRKVTGLSKPSLLDGLHSNYILPLPKCFCLDLMHLLCLNLEDLLLNLWRGTMKCDAEDDKATWDWVKLVGDTWQEHGKQVADATPYFPSSFHRPPRNPAEKLSSGYKATEYYLYVFGLGPGLFRTILPKPYWKNFCKLTRSVRILLQRTINGRQLQEAHHCIVQFVEEYEQLYYQRKQERLHFCRPCVHTLLHAAPEVTRVGPGAYTTQYPIERTIGDLGQEIKQPSNPFSNLAKRGLRRSQVNALKIMCPELDYTDQYHPPKYSRDIGNGFVLLRPRDRSAKRLEHGLTEKIGKSKVVRWGRLRLSNGQISRSLWCESKKKKPRVSRNVKFEVEGQIEYGEVQFFVIQDSQHHESELNSEESMEQEVAGLAVISVYSRPDLNILEESSNTLWVCRYQGGADIRVISVERILSVVSMQPLPPLPGEPEDLWFVVEKSGLEDAKLTGRVEED